MNNKCRKIEGDIAVNPRMGKIKSHSVRRKHRDSSSYSDRKRRKREKEHRRKAKSRNDDEHRTRYKAKSNQGRRDYDNDRTSYDKRERHDYKNDRKKKYERKENKTYRFDSPPLDYEFNKTGTLDKYGDLTLISSLLPTLANSKPEDIIKQLSEYQNVTKTQQFKLEKKLYIGSIPENITSTQVK